MTAQDSPARAALRAANAKVRAARRAKASPEDLAAAKRILATPETLAHDLFDQHIRDLIAEGRRLGRHVRVDLAPMTQWDPIDEEPMKVKVGSMIMVSSARQGKSRRVWSEEQHGTAPTP